MANITLKKIVKGTFLGLSFFASSIGLLGAMQYALYKLHEGVEISYKDNEMSGYNVFVLDGTNSVTLSRYNYFASCEESITIKNIFDFIYHAKISYTDLDCDNIVDFITTRLGGIEKEISRRKGDQKIFQDADKKFERLKKEFIQPKLEEKLKN